MRTKKFLRRVWSRHSKLGKGRKKKQKWRRPTGIHNKMRLRRKAYPVRVSIGYKQSEQQELINVYNLNDLKNLKEGQTIVLGKVGKKKKLEILKEVSKRKLKVDKMNVEKYIKNKTGRSKTSTSSAKDVERKEKKK